MRVPEQNKIRVCGARGIKQTAVAVLYILSVSVHTQHAFTLHKFRHRRRTQRTEVRVAANLYHTHHIAHPDEIFHIPLTVAQMDNQPRRRLREDGLTHGVAIPVRVG